MHAIFPISPSNVEYSDKHRCGAWVTVTAPGALYTLVGLVSPVAIGSGQPFDTKESLIAIFILGRGKAGCHCIVLLPHTLGDPIVRGVSFKAPIETIAANCKAIRTAAREIRFDLIDALQIIVHGTRVNGAGFRASFYAQVLQSRLVALVVSPETIENAVNSCWRGASLATSPETRSASFSFKLTTAFMASV